MKVSINRKLILQNVINKLTLHYITLINIKIKPHFQQINSYSITSQKINRFIRANNFTVHHSNELTISNIWEPHLHRLITIPHNRHPPDPYSIHVQFNHNIDTKLYSIVQIRYLNVENISRRQPVKYHPWHLWQDHLASLC